MYANSEVIDALNRFAQSTAAVIARLPASTLVPAFRNKDIGLRHQLGTRAAKLAKELSQRLAFAEDVLAIIDNMPEGSEDQISNQ